MTKLRGCRTAVVPELGPRDAGRGQRRRRVLLRSAGLSPVAADNVEMKIIEQMNQVIEIEMSASSRPP